MGSFKEMNPEDVRKALEGEQDVLSPMAAKEATFFRNSSCPSCHGYETQPFINPSRPFSRGSALPNKLLRCLGCSTEFDPYTGLVTKAVTAELG